MLNEALRLIRVFHDIKQTEAAQKLGISKSYLSEIEKAHKEPTLELLRKYERVFNIPMSSIMFFAESMDQPKPHDRARTFVAGKILKIMQFIEANAEHIHVK